MQRRTFLKYAAMAPAGIDLAVCHLWPFRNYAKTHLLSEEGCGRATGYAEANKIVTIGDKTHVSWLDSPPEGFRLRVRTYNHTTQSWSSTYTIDEAYDNHGGPALTVDSQGYLHIVYYPHHHAMRYRKSANPNDASSWQEAEHFGERTTYPTLVCGPDDTLYFTCRRSFDDRPWVTELWQRPAHGAWTNAGPILQASVNGYAHFQESLAWGPDGSLHLSCRFHEDTRGEIYGKIQTVGYMVSHDHGRSWQTSSGKSLEVPVTANNIEILDRGGVEEGKILRAGGMGVDAAGTPHVVYSVESNGTGRSYLARLEPNGGWKHIDLHAFLPDRWKRWDLLMPGALCFNTQNKLFICAQLLQLDEDRISWGHPSSEVVLFSSDDAGFNAEVLSQADPQTPNWLPSLERSTGHHVIANNPAVMFTAGNAGSNNKELLQNQVHCWLG